MPFCARCRPILKLRSTVRHFILFMDCPPTLFMTRYGFDRIKTLFVLSRTVKLLLGIPLFPALYTPKQRLTAAPMNKSAPMCSKCVNAANCFLSSTIRSTSTLTAAADMIFQTGVLPVCAWKICRNFMYKKEERCSSFCFEKIKSF